MKQDLMDDGDADAAYAPPRALAEGLAIARRDHPRRLRHAVVRELAGVRVRVRVFYVAPPQRN
jgi:hypothetical protein